MVARWKVFLAAFVIFVAGAATGAIVARTFLVGNAGPVPAQFRMSKEKRTEYVTKLADEVQLTAEQRQQVESIIAATQARIKGIWASVEPQVKEEYRCSKRDISAILTPEQRDKMKRWHKERNTNKAPSASTTSTTSTVPANP